MSSSTAAGSASVQRELWGVRAQDWADAMEGQMQPLYDAVLEGISVGQGTELLEQRMRRHLDAGGSTLARQCRLRHYQPDLGVAVGEDLLAF